MIEAVKQVKTKSRRDFHLERRTRKIILRFGLFSLFFIAGFFIMILIIKILNR